MALTIESLGQGGRDFPPASCCIIFILLNSAVHLIVCAERQDGTSDTPDGQRMLSLNGEDCLNRPFPRNDGFEIRGICKTSKLAFS